MTSYPVPEPRWSDPLVGRFLRFAASGWVPARWFLPELPKPKPAAAPVHVEIVSHCWNYAHFLVYQLRSIVQFPPTQGRVTMTVFYNGEDQRTADLLAYFGGLEVPHVTWNWCELPKQALFRRAIGRNQAALKTQADWIWFTDCDLLFREGCLDSLAQLLVGRDDVLVYPRMERVTQLLDDADPMLTLDTRAPEAADINPEQFFELHRTRATGPLQITHGDVARACGYCASLDYYQQPSAVWCKAHEDRAFRWLLRTQGVPLDIPGVYRIRHASKGRYTGKKWHSGLRSWIRQRSSEQKAKKR